MTPRRSPVFRVEKGSGPGLALVTGASALLGLHTLGVTSAALFWGLVVLATVVGYAVGNAAKRRTCSGCREPLLREDETCPGCGGKIEGRQRPRG
jgi:hypothetical protein